MSFMTKQKFFSGVLLWALAIAAAYGVGRWQAGHETHDHAESAAVASMPIPAEGEYQHDDHGHEHDEHAGAHAHHDHDGHGSDDEHQVEGALPLSRAQLQAAGIGVVRVERGGSEHLSVHATVVPQLEAQQVLTSPVAAVMERWLLPTGSAVAKGQPLAVLQSSEAVSLRAEQRVLAAEQSAAEQLVVQNQQLFAAGIIARQEWKQSLLEVEKLRARSQAAQTVLQRLAGLDDEGRWQLLSPAEGVLNQPLLMAGEGLAAGGAIAQWVDPARRQLTFSMPAAYAGALRTGMVVVPHAGEWQAQITSVSQLESQWQFWAQAQHGELPPLGEALMVTVVLAAADDRVSVPQAAVQQWQGQSVVFVVGDTEVLAQVVLPGRTFGSRIEILSGLEAGQIVAGENAFLLKAELAKGEAAHEH